MKEESVIKSIFFLWRYLGRKRYVQFLFLFFLMIISIFFEIISIGLVIPFLSALANPEVLMKLEDFQPLVDFFNIQSSDELLLPLTIGFISVSLFSAALRILLLWTNTHLSANMGIELRTEIYKNILYQPYESHLHYNSSELISILTEKVTLAISSGIMHVLLLMTAFFTSFIIVTTLMFINLLVALGTFLILGGGYLLIAYLVRKEIKYNGDIIAKNKPKSVKNIQEGIGAIRNVIMDNTQGIFIQSYENVIIKLQVSNMKNSFFSTLPKSLIEVMSILLIVMLAYYFQGEEEYKDQVFPLLGALALAAQRLLPALQQIYFSWSTINGNQKIIIEIADKLKYGMINSLSFISNDSSFQLKETINLNNLGFKYKNADTYVLNDINLTILKGMKVGFIGKTGTGKSTLLDIIMGLINPFVGELRIDGIRMNQNNIQAWQSIITHVPQSIFLLDASLAENIAFGICQNDINMSKVKEVARQACLDTFIESLSQGYETSVGERGLKLSGGQRQRIGIARALYKEASVIIFDEATSALDTETEMSIMKAIYSLNKDLTILIIAHRLSTLKDCDIIYKLENTSILLSGTYEEIIKEGNGSNTDFKKP